jgi:hypothetical protein
MRLRWGLAARLDQSLPASADLVFFSFDPYMISRVPVRWPEPANLYPADLDLIAATVEVQSRLSRAGLEVAAKVRPLRRDGQPNLQMMSLVLTRALPWVGALQDLEARFHSWLRCAIGYADEVPLGS